MSDSPTRAVAQTVGQMAALPAVHRAFQWFDLHGPTVLKWQCDIAAVPAPPFGESERAQWLYGQFQALGLDDVQIDPCGNVLGWLRAGDPNGMTAAGTSGVPSEGASKATDARPCLLLSAHLDTVFPSAVMRAPVENGTVLLAPSICDNAAGVAALLAVAAAMRASGIVPATDILFVGNVGEEGEGDLRGMRYLFHESPLRQRILAAVVLDGAGTDTFVTEGVGSRRSQVSITGPGGHSWGDAGTPNPILALAAALTEMRKTEVPPFPRTTWNVGRIEGGIAINAVPEKAEAQIDIRSTDEAQLLRLEVALHRAVEDAVLECNRNAATPFKGRPLSYSITKIGDRPAARLPEDALVLAAIRAVDRHLGIRSAPRAASTDANIPLFLGIEAIGLGSGGSGGGTHTCEEWYDPTGRDLGLRRILLLLLALAPAPF